MTAATHDGGGAVDQTGSAVVESLMVMVLLSALFLGVVQVGLSLHVRNTLVAAAAEGARYAANADRTPTDGEAVTVGLAREALGEGWTGSLSSGTETVGGVATVWVEVRADLPVVGLWGPSGGVVVRGHALEESSR